MKSVSHLWYALNKIITFRIYIGDDTTLVDVQTVMHDVFPTDKMALHDLLQVFNTQHLL